MKKLALLVVLMVTGLTFMAQNVNLVNGFYTDEKGFYFTGFLVTKDANGITLNELNVKFGLLDGTVAYYYPSGKLLEMGNYSKGLKTGQWVKYTEHGTMLASGTYNEGKKDGSWLVWDNNGIKRNEMHYLLGEKVGTWRSWGEKGEILVKNTYSNQ